MPDELRQLLFRPVEVVQAVADYHRRMSKPLPSGTVLACAPECDPGGENVKFSISYAPDLPADHPKTGQLVRKLLITGPELAAALILHCHQLRIPMPAKAEKSLQVFGNRVCLVATIVKKPEETDLTSDEIRL
jgi:hypothetical protein